MGENVTCQWKDRLWFCWDQTSTLVIRTKEKFFWITFITFYQMKTGTIWLWERKLQKINHTPLLVSSILTCATLWSSETYRTNTLPCDVIARIAAFTVTSLYTVPSIKPREARCRKKKTFHFICFFIFRVLLFKGIHSINSTQRYTVYGGIQWCKKKPRNSERKNYNPKGFPKGLNSPLHTMQENKTYLTYTTDM